MPIYEFSCESCGARFERLVDAGTGGAECPECGAGGAPRVLSAQAAPMRLVKSRGDRRKQERRNETLRKSTRANFKAGLRRGRERGKGG
jgi:putative FmdB family regulatory protein